MGLVDWLKGRRKSGPTVEEVRREEIRLGIRERQLLAKLEKVEREREEIFRTGSRTRSPLRRRQLARQYEQKGRGLQLLERELAMLSKEIATITALKLALERRQMSRDGLSSILERLSEVQLQRMLEDDKITSEMYLEKLEGILSTITQDARDLVGEVASEGAEVLEVWQKMDEGEIDSLDAGLRVARERLRQKERGGRTEAEQEPE